MKFIESVKLEIEKHLPDFLRVEQTKARASDLTSSSIQNRASRT